jgi:hypothetical protein
MLQPRTYPELIGKALVLEAEPFVTLVDDDEPWVEGLFLTLSVGVVAGIARLIGGLLLSASLPPANGMIEAVVNGWQRFNTLLTLTNTPQAMDATLRQWWWWLTLVNGYDSGWLRLLTLISTPLSFVAVWLVSASVVYLVARAWGGSGTFNQTLGATALVAAPHIFSILHIFPFVSVSALLLTVWGVLILYRAAEVAHNLPWQRALIVALTPLGVALLFGLAALFLLSMRMLIGGMV